MVSKMKQKTKLSILAILIIVVSLLATIAFYFTAGYVAVHFIAKYW